MEGVKEEENFTIVGVLWQYGEVKEKVNFTVLGVVSAWSPLFINMLILLPGL